MLSDHDYMRTGMFWGGKFINYSCILFSIMGCYCTADGQRSLGCALDVKIQKGKDVEWKVERILIMN